MERITDDPAHPGVVRGPPDEAPVPQHETYLVLSEVERAKGFVRPLRRAYEHRCGATTSMGLELCETYARQPSFYGQTYCVRCQMHRPVAEFRWIEADGSLGPAVGT